MPAIIVIILISDKNEAFEFKDLRTAGSDDAGRRPRCSRCRCVAVVASFLGGASDTWAPSRGDRAAALRRQYRAAARGAWRAASSRSAWWPPGWSPPTASRDASVLEWALLLPLAMPAYVMAYAYTDWLQFTGPVQSALRAADRLAGARVLVSGGALASGRRGDAVVRALPLRLPDRAHRVPGSLAQRDRGRRGSPVYGALGRVPARARCRSRGRRSSPGRRSR